MIEEILKKYRPGIKLDSNNLIVDYSIDSFEIINIIKDIENAYNISVDIAEINFDDFKTLESIRMFIDRYSK